VTTLPVIHQWAAGAGTGDAISGYVLALQKIIRSWGAESDFFVDYRHVSFDMRRHCRDLRSFPDNLPPGSIVIYHFSIGSGATARFLALPAGIIRVVTYHNITPARYFRALLPETAKVLAEGREQLRLLAPKVDLALGDSSYNCAEIEEAGCRRTALVPLIRNDPDPGLEPDPLVLSHYGDGAVNWLTVGRVAPNKKVEDVIRAFYYYRKTVHPHARLFIVGSGMPHYLSALQALTVQLDLPGVIFAGHVSAAEIIMITGGLGCLHAWFFHGCRWDEGWAGFGNRIHRADFKSLARRGPPLQMHSRETRARTGAQRVLIRYEFHFRQEGRLVYFGDQTAMFLKGRGLGELEG
jgi:glycosyltransferase involved in cell wall biosynthesis